MVEQTTISALKKGDRVTFFGPEPIGTGFGRDENPLFTVSRDWDPADPGYVYTDDPSGSNDKGCAHDMSFPGESSADCPVYRHTFAIGIREG